MRARVAQSLITFLVSILVMPFGGLASGQGTGVSISQEVPDGVGFQVLAEHQSHSFGFDKAALRLDRFTMECGQATGQLFGMEQLTYVEYGSVDVYDWDSGQLMTTLLAGQSLGPLEYEESFFLASAKGHRAVVYRFSHGGGGDPGGTVASLSFETTDCGSGMTQEMPAAPAMVETLYVSDFAPETSFETDYVVYAGVLTVQPGAALGHVMQGPGPAYVSNGAGVMLPMVGGFGPGVVGMGGIVVPEVRPGEALQFGPQDHVALENHGSAPTVAYVFGVIEVGKPVFQALHR